MSHDAGTALLPLGGASGGPVHGELVGLREAPDAGDSSGGSDLCGTSGDGACGVPTAEGKLSATTKMHIEREARRAAWDGRTRTEACRYTYDTPAGEHWTAAYVLAGGLIR